MDLLPDDVLERLLGFVPPADLLQSTAVVSKRFARAIQTNLHLWWSLARRLLPALQYDSFDEFTLHQIQRACLLAAVVRDASSSEERTIPGGLASFFELGSLLVSQPQALSFRFPPSSRDEPALSPALQRRVCLASTVHSDTQALEFVMAHPIPRLPRFLQRWWSSNPSPLDTSHETLLFTTRCPLALLTRISILPLNDPHTHDKVYNWKHMRIQTYRFHDTSTNLPRVVPGFPTVLEFQDDDAPSNPYGTNHQACIDTLLQGHTPVYECEQKGPPKDSSEWIHFDFGMGVLANVIAITLMGKYQRQFHDSGYYACIQQLNLTGIPLYQSRFQVEPVD